MEHIRARLEEFLNKADLKGALLGLALKEVLGKEANKASFHAFKNGVLWVRVPSPAWANELMSKKAEIIKKINILFQEKLVTDLKTLVYSRENIDYQERENGEL